AMRTRPTAAGQRDKKLTSLLREVINKRATEQDVQKAASAVEAYVAENEQARKDLSRIVNTVVNSGRLANYGTEPAQQVLKGWQKKFGSEASATQAE
ncbi:MAG: hypothetical protein MI861_26815, partial [Pirellulales bacterium]|nr:hypothetical protein [Pirellulales bacterium]